VIVENGERPGDKSHGMTGLEQIAQRDKLVQRAIRDCEAFGLLFDTYYPRVLRYCIARLRHRAAGEDATSETFLQVARHLPGFPGRTDRDFCRWIYRIATNVTNEQIRRQRTRREITGEAFDLAAPADDRSEFDWNRVALAVAALPEYQQALITLRFLEQFPIEEIATIVERRPGAVRTAISRALSELRRVLAVRSPPSTPACKTIQTESPP
jgi:RNA polymerase sigma factor (sigma-70 family)